MEPVTAFDKGGVLPMDFAEESQYSDADEHRGCIELSQNDVLMGRASGVRFHSGNENYRKLVATHKSTYMSSPKEEKASIAKKIVDTIRSCSPSGRFLDKTDDGYVVTPDEKALEKVMQALRERPTYSRESAGQTDTLAFAPWDRSSFCDHKAFHKVEVFGDMVLLTSKGRPRMLARESFGETFDQDENKLANIPIEPSERLRSIQAQTDVAICHMPPKIEPKRCNEEHGNDKMKRQDSHCLSVGQFSDSIFDDTPTSVAIFHQCRRDGFL